VEGYHRGVVPLTELAGWYGDSSEQLLEQLGPPRYLSVDDADLGDDAAVDEDAPLFPAGFAGRTTSAT
jgi:hypothetical protein